MQMGEHAEKTAHLLRGCLESVARQIPLNKGLNILFDPLCTHFGIRLQTGFGVTASEPEFIQVRTYFRDFRIQKRRQFDRSNPSRQTLGNLPHQTWVYRTEQIETAGSFAVRVDYRA